MSPDAQNTPDAPSHYRPATYAATDPGRPAVITAAGQVVTFGELEERSCRLAQALYAHGLREGDHVAVLMLNDDRTHEVAFGLQRAGLYYTMVNTHLTAEEAGYIVRDCGAHTLITSRGLNKLAADMLPHTPDIDLRLVVGGFGPLPDSHTDYDQFVAPHPATPLDDEKEGFSMLYSSGTTGHPKGVRRALTGEPFGTSATLVPMLERIMDFKEGDVYLSPAPLYHSAPLVWSMTVHRMGGTVVVMDKFDPQRCLELIDEHKVTHAQFVPTMFVRLLKLPDDQRDAHAHDLTSLRSVVHAAAPCAPEVKRRMIEWWGPIIHEYYSGTEGLGMTWITSEEALTHPGSVGRAIWGEAHVCGEDGAEMPTGEDGVVYFGSRAGVTFEYNGDPEKTRQSFNDKGWATLWDVGHLDDDGYLYLTDRKQFMIVSGGVNIYPQEIEAVLVLHPAVADVAVFGVPEAEMGEEVKAVVEATPGYEPGPGPELEQEILAFCREHLSHYKCPRSVDFTDALPGGRTASSTRSRCRDAYWASSAPSTT